MLRQKCKLHRKNMKTSILNLSPRINSSSFGQIQCQIYYFCLCTITAKLKLHSPLVWGCRIHPPHLYRKVRLTQRVNWIRHTTICWCGSSNAEGLGNANYITFRNVFSKILTNHLYIYMNKIWH